MTRSGDQRQSDPHEIDDTAPVGGGNRYAGDVSGDGTVNQYYASEVHHHHHPREPAVPPRELPGADDPWVDRVKFFKALDREVIEGSARLVLVRGKDHSGRTSMVDKWAESRQQEHFPDGTIYRDIRADSIDGTPDLHRILLGLLGSLGDRRDFWADAGIADLAARWRSLTAEKRLLIVLDNCEDAAVLDQVRVSNPQCTIFVISRYNGRDFAARGAYPIKLGRLDVQYGLEMLEWFCQDDEGEGRIAADPDGATALVRSCAGRPDLLRLVGGALRLDPEHSIADLRHELIAEGGELSDRILAADTIVTHSIARTINAAERVLLRRLSAVPSESFSPELANWLADGHSGTLDRLIDAQLVAPAGDGRRRLTDVVHEHDFSSAESDDTTDTDFGRITAWFLRSGRRCDDMVLGKDRLRFAEIDERHDPLLYQPDTPAAALRWILTEFRNLTTLQELAVERGDHSAVWAIEELLWVVYQNHPVFDTWEITSARAIDAAHRDGRAEVEARMRQQRMMMFVKRAELDKARDEIDQAIALVPEVGSRLGASIIEFEGILLRAANRHRQALERFFFALTVNRQLGLPRAIALQERLIGQELLALGQFDLAETYLILARDGMRARSAHHTSRADEALAQLKFRTGDFATARTYLDDIVKSLVESGSIAHVPKVYESCGDNCQETGATALARECWGKGLEWLERENSEGSEAAQRIRRKLRESGNN